MKWQQHPYGDPGGGFWVVALIGRTVIWYNDVEEGFNRSCYSVYGEIEDYWCNEDELEFTIAFLVNALNKVPILCVYEVSQSRFRDEV